MENNKENAIEKINSFYEDEQDCIKKKARHFDEISKLFYDGNFGSANKSEIELIMFSIFMDEMIEHYADKNGVLDYKECSDYKIARLLGIPQQRVKTLKIKKQARYPVEFDWKKSFETIWSYVKI